MVNGSGYSHPIVILKGMMVFGTEVMSYRKGFAFDYLIFMSSDLHKRIYWTRIVGLYLRISGG